MIIFKIGDLHRSSPGTQHKYNIDEKCEIVFDEDNKPTSNLKYQITLMKIENGIMAIIKDLSVVLTFACNKCGVEYEQKIEVPQAERLFYFEQQNDESDLMDLFYVDMKNMEVDVEDFIRQEIILHFPMIPVHSNSCKGLCPKCGINLNDKSCDCKISSNDEKPLAILKQLYNAKTSGSKEEDG